MEHLLLSDAIEKVLSEAYSLKGDALVEYLIKRYMLLNKVKRVSDISLEDFAKFITDILYIKVENDKFMFGGDDIHVTSSIYGSVFEVIVNWPILSAVYQKWASAGDGKIRNIDSYCEPIITKNRRKAYKIKEPYKQFYYGHLVLQELNSAYCITPQFPDSGKFFSPIKVKAFAMRTYEDTCREYVRSMAFESNDFSLVSEKDIEEYICKNFSKFFPKYTLMGRQVSVGDYIIDMLASDDDTVYVIEIKNKKDDRLYWQATNYYNICRAKYEKDVKVITIAPEYSDEMLKSLNELYYVTTMKFDVKINAGKISAMNMKVVW